MSLNKLKIMKHIYILFTIASVICLQSFCSNNKIENHCIPLIPSTLDSLQGNWISTSDSSWNLNITGRIVEDVYTGSSISNEYYRLYFSDTLVDGTNNTFNQIKIDTNAVNGKYIIEMSLTDGSIDCYKINGFSSNGKAVGLIPTWSNHSPKVFKKK